MPISILKTHQNQNQLVRFMVDEGDANFNELLKALILKTQNQDVFWNRYLSWFMYNRKNLIKLYSRKAIYKRNPESLTNIVNLGQLAIEDGNEEAARNSGLCLQNTRFRTAYSGQFIWLL
jgi:hypothetical protein